MNGNESPDMESSQPNTLNILGRRVGDGEEVIIWGQRVVIEIPPSGGDVTLRDVRNNRELGSSGSLEEIRHWLDALQSPS